ncbi:hypothetical protein [Leptolyngbya sp. FACHB-261]|uniref:hypothetical protein n=1 Tax=Leptolyngbya sp. FACHB-261 TaxID=2692806 RepID=UPI001686434B|nr:hypothetical protein [Leptolyngbya sp. FACHB-261]MBD2100283.1 hypothetical protein [Leptolyngbya sp. FACHB-261]
MNANDLEQKSELEQKRLNPWALVRLLPKMQRVTVGRFRKRSDADGHLQILRQTVPQADFIVVWDAQEAHDL